MPKERYMCQLCANHGRYDQPKKGHKRRCPYTSCGCRLCGLNTRRRALDQMERQMRVVDSSTRVCTKQHIQSSQLSPSIEPNSTPTSEVSPSEDTAQPNDDDHLKGEFGGKSALLGINSEEERKWAEAQSEEAAREVDIGANDTLVHVRRSVFHSIDTILAA